MIRQPIICVMGHVDHGKCVSGDTLLEIGDGRIMSAESAFNTFNDGSPISQPDGIAYKASGMALVSVDEWGKASPRDVSHVLKLKADRLIRVTTKAGYEIKTTPEHKFLVFCEDGTAAYKKAEELRAGDLLLVPLKTDTSALNLTGIKERIIEKLPDTFLVKISKGLNEKIVRYCSGRVYKLAGEIGDATLDNHLRRGFYRPSVLMRLLFLMGYPKEEIYDNIDAIKSSTKKRRAGHTSYWLKIPHEREEFEALYYAVGLLFGDGIGSSAKLSNTSQVLIDKFGKCLTKSFGIGITSAWRRTSYIVDHKGGRTFSKFLVAVFDYPEKDKTRILALPDIVSMSDNSLAGKFVQGFFDAEGFAESENYTGSIGVSCESQVLMRQLPALLHRFGCLSYFVKRYKRTALEISISGLENLAAFAENIGFTEPSKAEKLNRNIGKAVSSRIFDMTPLSGRFVKELRGQYNIHGRRGFDLGYYESKNNLTRYAARTILGFSDETAALPVASVLSSYKTVAVTGTESLKGDFSVYDFTVDGTHNFMANNLIVHNTSLLDKIRSTTITVREAGGITQHIGASEVPLDVIKKIVGPLLEKFGIKITIPGLLFIDTPGHEAFTNLRKRGGSVADLAILVVDVTKSFEPQTYEAIEILKEYRTPFIVAANKIDAITGWMIQSTNSFTETISKQRSNVVNDLEAKIYGLVGKLSELGFNSERFDRVKDFKKEVIIVPVSAKTGEGLGELLMYATGLAQRFLEQRLEIEVKGPGRGNIIEKKEDRGLGSTIDVILYNGTLKVNDTIAFATSAGIDTAKIKALLKPKELQELRESSSKFYYIDSVSAASGIKISASNLDGALPGSLVLSTEIPNYEQEIKSEISEIFDVEKTGVILKADTMGSIEALSRLLGAEKISISKKEIGRVTKRDVLDAYTMKASDPYGGIVLAFNVPLDDEAKAESEATGIRVINSNIIYKIIDDYKEWADAERKIDKEAIEKSLVFPGKLTVLPNSCFRVSHPAVFGVKVERGRLRPSWQLMNQHGEIVGRVKEMQDNAISLKESKAGESIAISMEDVTFGRQVRENETLYTFMNDENERSLRYKFPDMLDNESRDLLDEISNIKARAKG